jgi:hypothetical protein
LVRWQGAESTDGNAGFAIGRLSPIPSVAPAVDQDTTCALLVRRDGETFEQLLARLDRAIQTAVDDEIFIDEINNGPDDRILRRRFRRSSTCVC